MNDLKKWKHEEIRKLLQAKPDSIRKDHLKVVQTFELTFPYAEITDPVKLWSKAAGLVNESLGCIEQMIKEILLCKTRSEWKQIKALYQPEGSSK